MKPYIKLRTAIMAADKTQDELAAAIAVNPATFSKKITGKGSWTLWEAYTLCDILGVPSDELTEYFPKELAVPFDSVAEQLRQRELKSLGQRRGKR